MKLIENIKKVLPYVQKAGAWLRGAVSEDSGIGSASRIALLLVSSTVCGLLIADWHAHHQFPDHTILYGLAALLSAVAGTYAANQWGNKDTPPAGTDGDKG